MKIRTKFLSVLVSLLFMGNLSFAYNLKQIADNNNLSNSSITSFCQDEKGLMLIGTCDGLNVYNSREVSVYQPEDENLFLSGNLIDKIIYTGKNIYWIQTYYGLNKFDISRNSVVHYNDFQKLFFIEKDSNNNLFIIRESNSIYYYHAPSDSFKKLFTSGIIFSDILHFFITPDNVMWIITNKGYAMTYTVKSDSQTKEIKLEPTKNNLSLDTPILKCFYEDDCIYYVDTKHDLYTYDIATNKNIFIASLQHEAEKRGKISSLVRYHDSFFIGFQTKGLLLLEKQKNETTYQIKDIEIESGIFCLKKDQLQDIVWIGTDGKGVYTYSNTAYSIKSTNLSNLSNKIERPIRALYLDHENTLWVGSKGDGMLRIFNYNMNKSVHSHSSDLSDTSNSELLDNAVYAFAKSNKNILWIGTEEGLNYYSYKDQKIKKLNIKLNDKSFKYIHDIYETANNELWLTSVGMGIIKARIRGDSNNPELYDIQHITINKGDFESNYFFSIYAENDSTIYFGNRGYGPFKFNNKTRDLEPVSYYNQSKNRIINDVFAIRKDSQGNFLLGTSYGLVKYQSAQNYDIFNNKNGFLNNSIHAIQHEGNDNFWLSTNHGIIAFNSKKNVFRIFEKLDGLNITEFSDGASFKDEKSGTLFFGGINGFVSIQKNLGTEPYYMPQIYFEQLSIFGKKQNIDEKIDKYKGQDRLSLQHNQNFFSVSFIAIDYNNGGNYTYLYKLDGLSDQWINNGQSNTASFTNITPGEYTLQVKYYNRTLDKESPIYSLRIKIYPPWYETSIAYIIYSIILLGLFTIIVQHFRAKERRKKQAMLNELGERHQKEVFESKLRFFTNIAHEFGTPLTLISGPCARILNHPNIDSFVSSYVSMIQSNANRLQNLIHELIEFRRIETGNRALQIETLPITKITQEVLDMFTDMAESRSIQLSFTSEKEINWNSDKGFFVTVITNLVSNAFKYTPIGKKIRIEIEAENDTLQIKIANQAANQINEKDYKRIFDRYTILNNFENQENNQPFPRNGLGLAISYNIVKLLNGTIKGVNLPDSFVQFTISLPQIETNIKDSKGSNSIVYTPVVEQASKVGLPSYKFDPMKLTIVVLDDEVEILWFISEIFSAEYNVITTADPLKIESILAEHSANVIISDIMMSQMNGIELANRIRSKEETAHIPIILVSGQYEEERQIEALEAGVDLYITKPFNPEYLKVSVEQLINRKEKLKDYFNSPISSYELVEGKLTHKEHKRFLQSVLKIIEANISNKELSTQFIADELGIGSRSLYRKMKEIGDTSSADLIKEYRLGIAENLLIKSKLTIDEIVYKSGFSNKVTFFKAFNKKFDCTPKEYRMKMNKKPGV